MMFEQLGIIGMFIALIIYLTDKCGIWSWISKRVHSYLPREKSMAVKRLIGPGMFQVKTTQGIHYTDKVEYLDMNLVLPTLGLVYPYYQVLEIKKIGESWKPKGYSGVIIDVVNTEDDDGHKAF